MKAAGWSGMMSLPRVLSLDADGTLRMETLPGLSWLRAGRLPHEETRAGVCRILPRATGEVLCTGDAGKDFAFRMSDGASELLKVAYDAAAHSFRVDGKTIALEAGDEPSVHGFVDGSVVEVILGGRIGVTKRFYYTESVAPDIVVSAYGLARMEAWRVKAISGDRLTA
jgi:beta-fructofuranosidase